MIPALIDRTEVVRRLEQAATVIRAGRALGAGCSERSKVWSDGKCSLYHYAPIGTPSAQPPLLICYALVNRPYMLDLQPDRSLVRELLSAGIDVYLIDWGYPDASDQFTDLNDYINGYLDECVNFILRQHRIRQLNLLGVCQGGTLSVCYAALCPERIKNLITMVTPIDFKTSDNLLSKWAQAIDVAAMTRIGNISGDFLNVVYLALMPFRLTQQKYFGLSELLGDPSQLEYFLRMEHWIFDSPDQAAAAFAQFITWFYQQNRLIGGDLRIGLKTLDTANIRCPILNIYALKDHLVPPSASVALAKITSSSDYSELAVDVGHIGMYVSAKAKAQVPRAIAQWLEARRT